MMPWILKWKELLINWNDDNEWWFTAVKGRWAKSNSQLQVENIKQHSIFTQKEKKKN